ncbi:uncharacterized protein B0H64DRAFT_25902 [Chaetomium fimeti]|uniref:Uncharacterized protein n=1 Tax=Chaetomium fimeti TaxID=1854472 RepID=A0AAE0HS95_9PEZI|nr:hypothetical protein B0H64DRAFT_25902 [Chaetomium fimeti]
MGSVAADSSEEQPFTVLITGFGPFKRDYPVNPSWEIVHSLPTHLPPLRAKAPHHHYPSSSSSSSSPPQQNQQQPAIPPVRLLVHPSPIRVNYQTVRALVPQLWDLDGGAARTRIDAAIHVGMAGPRLFYSIERRGHRDGYGMPDVDGELLGDEDGEGGGEGDDKNKDKEGGGEGKKRFWKGLPAELETALDVEDVLGRWRGHSPKHMDLRISEDAGHYLCDFIYFSSLAHLEKAGEQRKVLFLHVPSDASEHSIATGRDLLLQLVRSVVESEMAKREGKAEAAS